MAERFVYTNAEGEPVGCVDRCEPYERCGAPECKDGKKHFMQNRCENGRFVKGLQGKKLPLFRLPEVYAGIANRETIYFAEGEGKTERLATALKGEGAGGVPTTIAGGCNEELMGEHLAQLRGCDLVVVLTDSDSPGRAAARKRAEAIKETYPKTEVRIVDFYPDRDDGSDIGDFLQDARTFDEFCSIVESAVPIELGLLDDEIEKLSEAYADRLRVMGLYSASKVPVSNDDDQRLYRLGIESIDGGLGPMRPGQITTIGARQGEGKSSFALQIARTNAVKYTVLYAVLEETREDLRDKLLSSIMKQSVDEVEVARLHRLSSYSDAVDELAKLNLFLWEPRSLVPMGPIDRSIRAITANAEAVKADILIIDWTRFITGWKDGNPGGVCTAIVEELLAYAKLTRMHIVLISQLNRDAQGKRPLVSQLQDTGWLEQVAHKVILLWQPFSEKPASGLYDICEVIVGKNRRGRKFRGHAGLIGHIGVFRSLSMEEEQRAQCCHPKEQVVKEKIVTIGKGKASA